jgi:hypothetical protein
MLMIIDGITPLRPGYRPPERDHGDRGLVTVPPRGPSIGLGPTVRALAPLAPSAGAAPLDAIPALDRRAVQHRNRARGKRRAALALTAEQQSRQILRHALEAHWRRVHRRGSADRMTLAGPGNPPKRWLRALAERIRDRAERHASRARIEDDHATDLRRQHEKETRDTPAGVARRDRLRQRAQDRIDRADHHHATAQRAHALADRIQELAP